MSFSEDVGKRYEAYGWHVHDVGEDLSVETLERAAEEARGVDDRPSLIIVRSHIGYGSPEQAGHVQGARVAARRGRGEAHQGVLRLAGRTRPSACLTRRASTFQRGGRARQASSRRTGSSALAAFREADPDAAAQLELIIDGRLPDGWDADLPSFSPDDGNDGHAQGLQRGDPVGREEGAAARRAARPTSSPRRSPTSTTAASVKKGDYGGRNVHYGVREHAHGRDRQRPRAAWPARLRRRRSSTSSTT